MGAALRSEAMGEPDRRPSAEAPHPAPQPTYPSNVPDPVGSSTSHGAPGTEYFFLGCQSTRLGVDELPDWGGTLYSQLLRLVLLTSYKMRGFSQKTIVVR